MIRIAGCFAAVILILTTTTIAVPTTASSRPALDPPQGVFYRQYYSLYLGDVKCGWARYEFSRKNDVISSRSELFLKLSREGFTIELANVSKNTETLSGRPLTFLAETSMGPLKTIHQGKVENGKASLTITQMGQSSQYSFDMPDDVCSSWGEYRHAVQAGLDDGSVYTVRMFDPQLGPGKFVTSTVRVGKRETIDLNGMKVLAYRVVAETTEPVKVTAVSFVDEASHPLTSETQIGPIKLTLVAASEVVAKSNLATKEFFDHSLIKLDKPLELSQGDDLTVRITFTGQGKFPIELPETSRQKIVSRSADSVTLKILARIGKQRSRKEAEDRYLADSTYLNLKDATIQSLALQAVKGKDTPIDKAKALCEFVYKYVETKDLSVTFAPAAEVAKSRQGDCTEHAVLLAALGRVYKLPTRGVVGLVYARQLGQHGAFGYHMWTQFFIDGRWVDLDAALGQLTPDATHIALAVSDLTDAGFADQSLKLVPVFGQLTIEQVARSGR